MGKKFAFTIESGLATNYLTDSKYIKDSYYVVADLTERDNLAIAAQSDLTGAMCFVEDARTPIDIANDVPKYGRYFKYVITEVSNTQIREWKPLDASDVQLNDSQNLSQILPIKYLDPSGIFIKTIILSEDEYYDMAQHDPQTLYLLYESDIRPSPSNSTSPAGT